MTIADLYKSIAEAYTKVSDPLTCDVKLSVNNGIITKCYAASAYVDDEGDFCIDSEKEPKYSSALWQEVSYAVGDFSEIKIVINKIDYRSPFSTDEISRISGCIGYALRQYVRGENLSDPQILFRYFGNLTLRYYYDSTKTASDDPDFVACFSAATDYIKSGTPIRKTNRTGVKGTRLVEGVSDIKEITFCLR